MSPRSSAVLRSGTDTLQDRLDDPATAQALASILDHADLLAILVTGLDAFVARSETITDSISTGVTELRSTTTGVTLPRAEDVAKLIGGLGSFVGPLSKAAPLLERVVDADLTSEAAMNTVSLTARAIIEGHERAQTNQTRVSGVRALLKALKDDDVSRGLGFLIEISRALGRELDNERKKPHHE
jgi:hypothetical protein